MEKGPSWDASSYTAGQEILRLLWKLTIYYRVHKWQPVVSVLS
jgi:hypothetical protein